MAIEDDRFETNRVDELLDALGRGERPGAADSSDDALFGMLLDWRSTTEAAPLPSGPSEAEIDAAFAGAPDGPRVASLADARERRDRRSGARRWSTVLVGAASVVAVAVGSVSVMAYNAQPGSPLWDVNKSLFGGSESSDVELVSALERDLAAANDALRRGDQDEAGRLLKSVSDRLDGVDSAADRVNLIRLRDQIQRELDRGDAGARGTVPPAAEPTGPAHLESGNPEPSATPQPSANPVPPSGGASPTGVPPSLAQIPPTGLPVPPVEQQAVPTSPQRSVDPVSPISPDDLSMLRATSVQPTQQQEAPATGGGNAESSPRSGSPDGADSGSSKDAKTMRESQATK